MAATGFVAENFDAPHFASTEINLRLMQRLKARLRPYLPIKLGVNELPSRRRQARHMTIRILFLAMPRPRRHFLLLRDIDGDTLSAMLF